jgi:hypothetical protein
VPISRLAGKLVGDSQGIAEMWNAAIGLFWVAIFVGLTLWSCPLPELKNPAGDAVKEPEQALDEPAGSS